MKHKKMKLCIVEGISTMNQMHWEWPNQSLWLGYGVKFCASAETDRPCSHCLLHSIQSANRPGCNRLLFSPSVLAHTTTHSTQVHTQQTALLESCAPHRFWPHKTGAIQTCNALHCWACCWEVAKRKNPCTFLLSASEMSTRWAYATTPRPSSHGVVSTGSPVTAWRYKGKGQGTYI